MDLQWEVWISGWHGDAGDRRVEGLGTGSGWAGGKRVWKEEGTCKELPPGMMGWDVVGGG